MQCLVIDISDAMNWANRNDTLAIPKRCRPDAVFATKALALEEAARLSCTSGNSGGRFAVFELWEIANAQALSDSDRIRGIGPCGAFVPKWEPAPVEI